MADSFSLPTVTYKELSKAIIAYANQRHPLSLDEFSQIAGVPKDSLTRNNPFLVDSGLITPTQKKSATALGKDLGRALDHDVRNAIKEAWSKVVSQNDYFQRFVDFVRNRGPVDSNALAAQVCLITGSPKNSRNLRGAATVIQILVESGQIESADGKYRYVKPPEQTKREEKDAEGASAKSEPPEAPMARIHSPKIDQSALPSVNINLQIHIAADASTEQVEQIFKSIATHLYKR